MNSEKKLFLPDTVLFEASSFSDYVNELTNRLYSGCSLECLVEKAENEHRAFRLLPLLLIQDENLWNQQINNKDKMQEPMIRKALVAVCVYLTTESIGHISFKDSLKKQAKHISEALNIDLNNQHAINDAKNLWKDLATYRYTQWKKSVAENKNNGNE